MENKIPTTSKLTFWNVWQKLFFGAGQLEKA
jgi:hypothetical protein